jgi:hypothetical protein
MNEIIGIFVDLHNYNLAFENMVWIRGRRSYVI